MNFNESILEVILLLVGGLVLFLYAVTSLSTVIRSVLGERAKEWLLRFTPNVLASILTGIAVTIILDSSSAVIIITIVFVNSQLLSLRQSLGIVLGANIGTTFSSQIIAMDVGKFSPILLLLGFITMVASKSAYFSNVGKVLVYFGILFFGLFTMENAVEPLKESPHLERWLQKTNEPIAGALIGGIATLIIQSSSATVEWPLFWPKKGFFRWLAESRSCSARNLELAVILCSLLWE